MISYSQIEADIGDAVRSIAAASSQLEAIEEGAAALVTTLNALSTSREALTTEINTRVGTDKEGDPAWEALKARNDEVGTDLTNVLARATAVLERIRNPNGG